MRDWISSISHLAPAIGIGFVLLSDYVGAVTYITTEMSAKDDRIETSVNTIAIAVLQQGFENIEANQVRIEVNQGRMERKIDLIGPRLPPPGFWCRGADCEN